MKTTEASEAVASTHLLGSSGFVFLDDRPWPFLVKEFKDGWWLCYWRDSTKQFATMRKLNESEVPQFRVRALPPEKAALYLPNAKAERP